MATTTCWNCGARSAGPKCQWCGAAQTPEAAQGPSPSAASMPQAPGSYYGSGAAAGQPTDWQNQRTRISQAPGWQSSPTIPGQPGGWQSAPQPGGYPQPPQPGQPGNWQAQPTIASQMGGRQAQPPAPGQVSGWQATPPQSYQQPPPGQPGPQPLVFGPPSAARGGSMAGSPAQGLPLGLAGGAVGGIIGAVVWAAILNATNFNISYIAVLLGILVGYGAVLGARGRVTMLLVILTGVLGLLAFFLGLYFRVSYLEDSGFVGLPLGAFPSDLSDYLQLNPLNYLYFALVPLAAAITTYRLARRR